MHLLCERHRLQLVPQPLHWSHGWSLSNAARNAVYRGPFQISANDCSKTFPSTRDDAGPRENGAKQQEKTLPCAVIYASVRGREQPDHGRGSVAAVEAMYAAGEVAPVARKARPCCAQRRAVSSMMA